MKIHPHDQTAEQAKKELKQVAILGLLFAVIGLVIFWFLGIIAIGFGARALLLSFNKKLLNKKDLQGWRAMGVGALVIGIFDVIGGIALTTQ
jgi:hypothetical protein